MESLFTVENLLALVTLSVLVIVLGTDNIVFISMISSSHCPYVKAAEKRGG